MDKNKFIKEMHRWLLEKEHCESRRDYYLDKFVNDWQWEIDDENKLSGIKVGTLFKPFKPKGYYIDYNGSGTYTNEKKNEPRYEEPSDEEFEALLRGE